MVPFTPQLPTVQQQPTTPVATHSGPGRRPGDPPTPAGNNGNGRTAATVDDDRARGPAHAPGARHHPRASAAPSPDPARARCAAGRPRARPPRSTPATGDDPQAERDRVAREEQQLDDEARSLSDKAKEVEGRMYSGEISSPRELQAMQADVEQLRRHQRTVENRELELMEEREPLDATIGDARAAARASSPPTSTASRAALAAAEAEIVAEMQVERAARDEIAAERRRRARDGVRAVPRRWPRARASRGSWAPPARAATSRSRPSRPSRSSAPVGSRSRTATTAARSWFPDARRGRSSTSTAARAATPVPPPSARSCSTRRPAPPARLAAVSERIGETTNNVAEYRGADRGARGRARRRRRGAVQVRGDSKLVIEQVAGRWKVKQDHLKPLHAAVLRVARRTTTTSTSPTCVASATPTPTRW